MTQVVWKGTQRLGCADFKGNVVCHYAPPGNMRGNNNKWYNQNVPAPTYPETSEEEGDSIPISSETQLPTDNNIIANGATDSFANSSVFN